jgi:hypothetical protein
MAMGGELHAPAALEVRVRSTHSIAGLRYPLDGGSVNLRVYLEAAEKI